MRARNQKKLHKCWNHKCTLKAHAARGLCPTPTPHTLILPCPTHPHPHPTAWNLWKLTYCVCISVCVCVCAFWCTVEAKCSSVKMTSSSASLTLFFCSERIVVQSRYGVWKPHLLKLVDPGTVAMPTTVGVTYLVFRVTITFMIAMPKTVRVTYLVFCKGHVPCIL